MRMGIGYDVHRLVSDRKLIIGGVTIPYEKGLLGHSDADVLIHAVIDAILGAAALGDIGRHFPDTDLQYKDVPSLVLLSKVRERIVSTNYEIINIDSTVFAQAPKLSPFRDQMTQQMANRLAIGIDQINIKFTTTEGLGDIGQGAGIAAMSVALLSKTQQEDIR